MTPELLRSNLCFLHGIVTASENLLCNAISHSYGHLKIYFHEHLQEETGHLKMVQDDLLRLGVAEPLHFPIAAELAGAQYYYIIHDDPAMLLGYMAALEGNPIPLTKVSELEAAYGPLISVRHHAEHDIEHGREIRKQMRLLDSTLRQRVLDNEAWILHELKFRATPAIEAASQYFLRN